MKRIVSALAPGLLAGALVLSGCLAAGNGTRSAGGSVPAEAPEWELVFQDDFNRAELGPDWEIFEGRWAIVNGALAGSGTLVSTRGFPGDGSPAWIRFEFEAVTDVKPFTLLPGGPPPKVSVSDISAFIHGRPEPAARPTHTGYAFQFGGFMNTLNRIRRLGQELVTDENPAVLITPDKVHRVVVENDAGRLRLIVDDRPVLEHHDLAPLAGDGHDRVGFYFFTAVRVNELKVFVRRRPGN